MTKRQDVLACNKNLEVIEHLKISIVNFTLVPDPLLSNVIQVFLLIKNMVMYNFEYI